MHKNFSFFIAALLCAPVTHAAATAPLGDWPRVTSAVRPDARIEARVREIVGAMTLAQKVGQMTQSEIKTTTPDDVRRYYLGSVLNGGGSWPGMNKHATAADWVALADSYYAASMSTDMRLKVPVIWGIDAIHGNSNVVGATQFPHNIGLGAAHNPRLVGKMGGAVAKAVRATGINWVFAPTLAVVQDVRWGRSYEGFSSDPALVRSYGDAYVRGLQGRLGSDGSAIATAKHFMGDGGTDQGKDQGNALATRTQMINVHGQGYYGALAAGAQTVMVSYNSWHDKEGGVDYGKMHGSKAMLTDVLKQKMGFDGFVVSDWNGIAQVPGCSNDSCAQAINAGIDMVMVPDDWRAFIANTISQVESGAIPVARIDDAVSRIVRVKLRARMWDNKPSASRHAANSASLQDRALARELVRQSLVLLKNDGNALPLARKQKVLVVGKGADSLPLQNGGWTLTWQGTDNKNSDFPNGDTILAGIVEKAGAANVSYSRDAGGIDVAAFDTVIAVIGELPYAEGAGDVGPAGTLRHSGRYPEDLALLKAVAGKGRPVVTVLLSGRPVYANDLINLSDSFVAAWLPGTEGKGVADVLFKGGKQFRGSLPFAWPQSICPGSGDAPLFAPGYGLRHGARSSIGRLDTVYPDGGCGVTNEYPVSNQADRASWPLYISSGSGRVALGSDLNKVFTLPGATVETVQVNTQQDGKRITWRGAARFEASGARAVALPAFAAIDGALQFDTIVDTVPSAPVMVGIDAAQVDVSTALAALAGKGKHTVRIPLACFSAKGADLARMVTPFSIGTDGAFRAAFANIAIVGGAAKDKAAIACTVSGAPLRTRKVGMAHQSGS